ncbi:ABC transporter ATP-binding protein [Streptomyces puniciscabiei]
MTTSSVPSRSPATAEATPETAVAVRDLCMRYGDSTVLHGLDLAIERGEIFALLGPNGAGKTTTIEILEGFRTRSSGQVSVLGKDPEDADEAWRARLGIVTQAWQDHGKWRVGELVGHIARYYSDPIAADELLGMVGLTEQAGKDVQKLSGGQRRRLDVALGIIGRPELLFLDEPTTGFDPEARAAFHDVVTRLSREQDMTIVLTTHDLAEAEKLATRIGILVGGRLAACGTNEELATAVNSTSEVRWTEPDGAPRRVRTPDPSEFVHDLHRRHEGPVPGLEVRRPSLEETYLRLIHLEDHQ